MNTFSNIKAKRICHQQKMKTNLSLQKAEQKTGNEESQEVRDGRELKRGQNSAIKKESNFAICDNGWI